MTKNYKLLLLFLGSTAYAQHSGCVQDISTHYGTLSVFTSDGTVYTWGKNDYGQVGNGAATQTQVAPYQRPVTPAFVSIQHSLNHSVALTNDGKIYAWGRNDRGQSGNGTLTANFVPEQVGTGKNWQKITSGWLHVAALRNDGTLWGWGNNAANELTSQITPNYADNYYTQPVQLNEDNDWKDVFAGYTRTFAIKNNGTLWARGNGSFGALGTGNTAFAVSFTQITNDSDWKIIANGGDYFTLALKTNGTLWAWGNNAPGTIGNGATTSVLTPQQIGTATWKAISAGNFHSLGIQTDGTLWQWGSYGWINGTILIPAYLSPTQVGNGTDWVKVAAGHSISFALKADQTVWAWGYNSEGWYGNGSVTSSATPVLIFQCAASSVSAFDLSDIILYPNPAQDNLCWAQNIPIEKVAVFNLNGKKVLSKNVTQNFIDVSSLASGTYFIKLESNNQLVYYSKFIKK